MVDGREAGFENGGAMPVGKRGLRVPDFSAEYGIGRTKTYEEIKAGRLQAVRAGGRTLIPREAADAWLAGLPPL